MDQVQFTDVVLLNILFRRHFTNTRTIGLFFEEKAVEYLTQKSYIILERNYQCRMGEIDIVAKDKDDTIVFFEVKARRTKYYGYAGEAITPAKQKKIINCARKYILDKNLSMDQAFRFDAILYDGAKMTHIKNAFF